MVEMINDRKKQKLDGGEEKYDLLSGLLSATQGELDGESQLTDSEVLGESNPALSTSYTDFLSSTTGNTFVFLLAGLSISRSPVSILTIVSMLHNKSSLQATRSVLRILPGRDGN